MDGKIMGAKIFFPPLQILSVRLLKTAREGGEFITHPLPHILHTRYYSNAWHTYYHTLLHYTYYTLHNNLINYRHMHSTAAVHANLC